MAPGRLIRHGVDLEALANIVLTERAAAFPRPLDRDQREAAGQWLLIAAWRLSESYEPGRDTGKQLDEPPFASWAHNVLCRRFPASWLREEHGATRQWRKGRGMVESQRPVVTSLEGPADPHDPGGPSVGESLTAGAGDGGVDCDPDLARVVAEGSRGRARLLEPPRLRPAGRAAR